MELQEWLDKLRWLSNEQLIKTHLGLQEQIKKVYKLRAEGNNLKKTMSLCEQQIAMAPLVINAMREQHDERVREASALGIDVSAHEFCVPSHHGYRQLSIILRKSKQFERVAELEIKRDVEGWSE